MAETNKILGQSLPAATTRTDAYTVPSATQAVVSSLMICNQSSSADSFQVSVAASGASHASSQFIYKDVTVPAGQTFAATLGVTLNTTDKLRVYSTGGNLVFTVFGVEVT